MIRPTVQPSPNLTPEEHITASTGGLKAGANITISAQRQPGEVPGWPKNDMSFVFTTELSTEGDA